MGIFHEFKAYYMFHLKQIDAKEDDRLSAVMMYCVSFLSW